MTESKSLDKTPLAAAASREKIETHRSLQSSRSSRLEDFPCPVRLNLPLTPTPLFVNVYSRLLQICHYISKGFWKKEDGAAPFLGLNNPVRAALLYIPQTRPPCLNLPSSLGTSCLRREIAS
jgi:hypothetical protein